MSGQKDFVAGQTWTSDNTKGTDTIGWYKPSDQGWHLRHDFNGGGCHICTNFGGANANNLPVVGDWDGDGGDGIGWYRPSDNYWRLRNDPGGSGWDKSATFGGQEGDSIPVTGDWDGDGHDTLG